LTKTDLEKEHYCRSGKIFWNNKGGMTWLANITEISVVEYAEGGHIEGIITVDVVNSNLEENFDMAVIDEVYLDLHILGNIEDPFLRPVTYDPKGNVFIQHKTINIRDVRFRNRDLKKCNDLYYGSFTEINFTGELYT